MPGIRRTSGLYSLDYDVHKHKEADAREGGRGDNDSSISYAYRRLRAVLHAIVNTHSSHYIRSILAGIQLLLLVVMAVDVVARRRDVYRQHRHAVDRQGGDRPGGEGEIAAVGEAGGGDKKGGKKTPPTITK